MKPATHEGLDTEQKIFHGQLSQAVAQINKADDLVSRNQGSEAATSEATALLLSAIARILVVQTAAEQNMVNRLPVFTNTPK
jgi:hypothetical protein